jgi:Family of unknown function (DUF6289)
MMLVLAAEPENRSRCLKGHIMFRRNILFVMMLAATALALRPSPARAFVPGDTLTVIAYYSDFSKTQLVGQKWSGCGQPSGSWGITTNSINLFFPAC